MLRATNTHTPSHTHTHTLCSPPSSHLGLAWVTAVAASWAHKKGALIKIRARNSRWSTNSNNKDNNNKGQKTLAQMSLLFGHFGEVSAVQNGGKGGAVSGQRLGHRLSQLSVCSTNAQQRFSAILRTWLVINFYSSCLFTHLSPLASLPPCCLSCFFSSATLVLLFF